jgi:hypothetical protein
MAPKHRAQKELEQVCQPSVSNEAFDQHKADCSDHDDHQDANQK